MERAREFKMVYFSFIGGGKAFDCVDSCQNEEYIKACQNI